MHLKRLLNTSLGKFFISVLLGLGLATLFRKACNDKNCLQFNGPVISEVDGKMMRFLYLAHWRTTARLASKSSSKTRNGSLTY